MKHIIREIEISKVTGEELTGDAKAIQEWFDDTFIEIEVKRLSVCPDSIFFVINESVYFEQDFKNDRLWCHPHIVWSFVELNSPFKHREGSDLIKYGVEYQEISDLIRYGVEQQLKCKVGVVTEMSMTRVITIEQLLKYKAGTLVLGTRGRNQWVEAHSKYK